MGIIHGDLCALLFFFGLFESLLFAAIGAFLRLASGLFFQSTLTAGKYCHFSRPPHGLETWKIFMYRSPHPDRRGFQNRVGLSQWHRTGDGDSRWREIKCSRSACQQEAV